MKRFVVLALALVMLLSLVACGGGKSELTFTTGGDQGTYYGFGTVLAGQISDDTDTNVTAIVGKGSKANIEAMNIGDAQLGFVQSDVMAYAYGGTNLFAEEGAIDSFSTVAALYMEQVQIVTLDPSIKSVADLAGKTVSVGETGSPTAAVTSLAATRDVYLVELDDEHIEKLIAASPYYTKNVIAADAYGLDADATTVAVGAVIIARDDVSEEDIYNVISGIFNDVDGLGHDKKSELSLEFAASVTDVPYHPGAAKYLSENGVEVPTK